MMRMITKSERLRDEMLDRETRFERLGQGGKKCGKVSKRDTSG